MNVAVPVEKIGSAETDRIQNLTAGLLLLPLMVAGIFLNAFVVLLFWNWFVTPLGPKPLGYWHALGLSVFISFVRGRTDNGIEKPRNAQDWKRRCKEGYTTLVFFWIIGWLVHLVMEYAGH